MNKLDILKCILDFIPELFPPDLSALTLSNTTHFIGVWGRPGNTLGQSIKTLIYPGKLLNPDVMLGQVIMQKRKITKYYTAKESISGIAYLAIGVPIYEDTEMVGGICTVREETILETQERCKNLLNIQEILAESMANVSSKLSNMVNSYREVRSITDYIESISQKANLIGVHTTIEALLTQNDSNVIKSISGDLQTLAEDSKEKAQRVVTLLNDFDKNNVELFSSIRQIETVVSNMSYSVSDIMNYLGKQSNMMIKDK